MAIAQTQQVLSRHHGTPPEMQRTRDAASKENWLCRKCVGKDAEPYRNFGHRTACHKCGLAKSACHKANVQPPPPRSLADRQVTVQKEAARIKELEKRNAALAKQLEQAKAVAPPARPSVEGEVGADESEDVPQCKFTVEQLLKQRALLLDQGASCADEEVERLDKQLKLQREAKLSSLPPAARVAKAGRQVASAEKRVAAVVEKRTATQEQIKTLQAKLAEQGLEIDKARAELEAAQQQRDQLYQELRPGADVAVPATHLVFGALEQVANALAPADVHAWGLQGPEQLAQVLAGLQKACEAATARAEAVAASAAAATKAAGAASAAAAPAPPSSVGRRPWSEEEENFSDMEVDVDEEKVKQALPPSMDDASRTQLMAVLATSVKLKKKVEKKKLGAKTAASAHKPGA